MTSIRTIGILVALTISASCARKVTIAPDLVYLRNDPDWMIKAQPAAPAAPASAPAPGSAAPATAPGTPTPAPAPGGTAPAPVPAPGSSR